MWHILLFTTAFYRTSNNEITTKLLHLHAFHLADMNWCEALSKYFRGLKIEGWAWREGRLSKVYALDNPVPSVKEGAYSRGA